MNRNMAAKCNLAVHLGEQNGFVTSADIVFLIVFSIMSAPQPRVGFSTSDSQPRADKEYLSQHSRRL